MFSAIESIAKFLFCEPHEIRRKMVDPKVRRAVVDFLNGHDIYLTYRERNTPINYLGLTHESAFHLPAYDGFMATSVNQHFYSRYRIKLRYALLPCVVEARGRGYSYFPLEVLKLVPKRNMII